MMRYLILLVILLFTLLNLCFSSENVTYDHRSIIINGRRELLISASIHYPRSVPAMWPELVQTAKDGGVNVIDTYVFWNGHERVPGNYYFGGRFNLVKFVKIVQQAGMYMILRIGPFVAAEWNYGGVPVWLHYVPGTVFRTDNGPFKYHMQRFMTVIVNLMKQHKLFASQGGPIILAQVENEYGKYYENIYGEGGKSYAMWAARMAISQNISVPWIMCWQEDAPDPVIDTCNAFYCDQFKSISPRRPKIWTENWPGWFKTFGSAVPHRPAEDVAFSVARFFQKGGSVQNYYMYHGGTNFGRTGGLFITTSYDYDAPIDEYGIVRLPKWGHLKELHRALKLCEHALLNSEPINLSLGPSQEADIYTDGLGACTAFIANMDEKDDKIVEFRNVSYHLPAWSVSILPDCKNVVFNTAKVQSQTSIVEMMPEKSFKSVQWEVFKEKAGIWGEAELVNGLVDHINTTKDTTDYLWYTTSITVGENEEFLKAGSQPVLLAESKGHVLHAFVNQELQASESGVSFKLKTPISLKSGKNEIALLSVAIGLQSAGGFYEWNGAGVTSVKIKGFNNGTMDLSTNAWTYKIGLQGEATSIYKEAGLKSGIWEATSKPPKKQPLTWYKAFLDPPPGHEPVGLDMVHMRKGMAWLNGKQIGRYWLKKIYDKCVEECNYRGTYSQKKCLTGCGKPTQRWYHIPRSWFKPSSNILVIFEEKGGDPTNIRFSTRKITGVCALVGEDYPSNKIESWHKLGANEYNTNKANVHLECPKNTRISTIKFASFGTPTGTCGSYSKGHCHDPSSKSVVEKVCLNKNNCTIELNAKNFKTSLCHNTTKKLAIEAVCS